MSVIFASESTAATPEHFFNIDPVTVEAIQVRTGWGTAHMLYADKHMERIQEIISTLNHFTYVETEKPADTSGWYVILEIAYGGGMEQSFEFSSQSVSDLNNGDDRNYICSDPDYFGDDWLRLLFPYPFTDTDMWVNGSVMYRYDNGFMLGTSKTAFSPEAVMTRGMFVTVLGRMAEVNEEEYRESRFEDVGSSDYFVPYVSWAYETGLAKGTSENRFSPNDPITREQAVLMLARFAETQGLEFAMNVQYTGDMAIVRRTLSDYFATSEEFQQKYAKLFYVLQPYTNRFDPTGSLTRREAAGTLESAYQSLYLE